MAQLLYKNWAQNRNEALPIGNGRLGALVYGNPFCDTLSLNEETLWSGAPEGTIEPYDKQVISKIQQFLARKQYTQAETFSDNYLMRGVRTQTYLPFGKLLFEVSHQHLLQVEDYRRELDLDTAVLSMHAKIHSRANSLDANEVFVNHKREVFSSLADDVLVYRFESDTPITCFVSLEPKLNATVSYADHEIYASGRCPTAFDEYDPENILQEDAEKESIPFAARVCFVTDGRVGGQGRSMAIYGATQITLLLSIATGFNGYDKQPISEGRDYRAICAEKLRNAKKIPYEALKTRHISAYQQQFCRTKFVIDGADQSHVPTDERLKAVQCGKDDPTLASLLFDYGKYLTISSSQPGGQPANLQGIWNEEPVPPWNSNYTLNINTQMNYWATETMNLPECHTPLIEMTKELAQRGNNYGVRGWCAAHNTDLWRFNRMATSYSMYGLWDMGGVWLARHIYDHFCYTQDLDFLKEYIDVLRGVYDFLEDRLTENEEGFLTLSPSTSPETTYLWDGKACSITASAAMDIQIIDDYLAYMTQLESLLNCSTEKYSTMRQKLMPLKISSTGVLLEYGEELEETPDAHQHLSHLYGIYPGNTIQKGTPLYDAARKALDGRMAKGGGNNGWANIWAGLCYARFGDGDKAYECLLSMLKRTVYPNLLNICPPFQIDGNFGVCALICEMLLHSRSDGYQLLPALPSAWKSGRVEGFKTRTGERISFCWNNGAVQTLNVEKQS